MDANEQKFLRTPHSVIVAEMMPARSRPEIE
jgi:hypothetical protein